MISDDLSCCSDETPVQEKLQTAIDCLKIIREIANHVAHLPEEKHTPQCPKLTLENIVEEIDFTLKEISNYHVR